MNVLRLTILISLALEIGLLGHSVLMVRTIAVTTVSVVDIICTCIVHKIIILLIL